MKLDKKTFMDKYIYYTLKMEEAMSRNNYRINNFYVLKANKLIEKCENEKYYEEALNELMDNENLKISADAAADSLRRNCNIDKAVKKLKEISIREDAKLVAFSAGIALETWLKNGKID